MNVRVLVVDDHPVFRNGLRSLIERAPETDLAGEASCLAEAVTVASSAAVDVVLMDLRLPDGSGIDATRRIVEQNPAVRVIVLTMLEDEASIAAAMQAGARGYLLKGADEDEILSAIRIVAGGGKVLGAGAANHVLGRSNPLVQFPQLTPREREVLDEIAAGRPNALIAQRLGLSHKTIRNLASTVFAKIGAPDRADAIIRARDAGLGRSR